MSILKLKMIINLHVPQLLGIVVAAVKMVSLRDLVGFVLTVTTH